MKSPKQKPHNTLDTAPASASTSSGENSAPEWVREIGHAMVDGFNRMRTDEAYRREIASRTK